ncbi:MAG: DUF2851 family protein [Verrucomicrobia bacterium]|nr:DUF2851 family protein [Verrucomicrobiota bacterium]
MTALRENFYSDWRATRRAALLRDAPHDLPPERLLQGIWFHQRVQRDRLKTLDGQTVRVLHPGFWNHEAGPDFLGAVVQLGSATPRTGDIEVDLEPSGWRGHAHATNPTYANVILHVVWSGRETTALPTLALKDVLDSPLDELAHWLGGESNRNMHAPLAGQCSAPLRELTDDKRGELLHQAAQVRLQSKAAHLAARAREAGWERALWEGLFAALGYKQNVWPMRRVAELLPQIAPQKAQAQFDSLALQARLLGVSGLLPDELTRKQSATDSHLRRLWDAWWRERDAFAAVTLPRSLWRFNGLRPANHPQRRLALAAHWLADSDFFPKLEKWFTATLDDKVLADSLLRVLQVERDEFWSSHWTFRSARMVKPQPLLGATRVTDLAVNVLLPWFWTRAVAGRNVALRREAERRYHAWPAAEDNAVLKLARQRLLGGASVRSLRTAAMQQGLLQIVRDFCEESDATCAGCRFPDLVRSITR